MKKLIYYLGLISAILLLFGALFKVMHWPGASIILTVSIFIYSFGFLPTALANVYRNQTEKGGKWLYIVSYIVFTVCLIGSLFKIQHWPGAGILLIIGIPLPFVLFLPVFLYHTRKPNSGSIFNFLGVMFGLTFLAVFSVLLALNVTSNVLDNFLLNTYHNENSINISKEIISSYDTNNEISRKSNEIFDFIETIKSDILTQSQNVKNDVTYALSANNRSEAVLGFIYQEVEGKTKAEVLMEMVKEYRELINEAENADHKLKELANNLLFESYEGGVTAGWVEKEFTTSQLAAVLNVLTQIQNNVKFIETEYITTK